jgi:beta-lactamase regulating signal transducer with metallopeptidase domain
MAVTAGNATDVKRAEVTASDASCCRAMPLACGPETHAHIVVIGRQRARDFGNPQSCSSVPEWFLSQASQDELSSTLSHELAHIRRHDFLWNLLYELMILPISFHPAAALIKARIDQTRELACDEIAAESMPTRTRYARSLLSIAQSIAANQRPATVGYAMGLFDANTLEDRIMNVLTKANRIRKTRAQTSLLPHWFCYL